MRVYVAHPYADDARGNVERLRAICRAIVDEGLSPQARGIPIVNRLFQVAHDRRREDLPR